MPQVNAARILIVDDDSAILMSHGIILERLGYEVVRASTAADALRSLSEGKINLLICDLSLDGDNGLDVIRAAFQQNREMPVILMTGYGDTLLPEDLPGTRVDVVSKPADIPELLKKIRSALQNGTTQDAG